MSKVAVYLRISSVDQEKGLASQKDALMNYCRNHQLRVPRQNRFVDKASGGDTNRPAFQKLQQAIFNGEVDTVVIWKLDRISRSLKDGVTVLCDWMEKDVKIIAVSQQLDFTGITGKIVMPVLFAIAEMERENIRENTIRGLRTARVRLQKEGRDLGRPRKLNIDKVLELRAEGHSVAKIALAFGVSDPTVYAALKRHREAISV